MLSAVSPRPELAGERGESDEHLLVESYRRLADVFRDVLAEQSRDHVLERIADILADLVPYDTLTILEADESLRLLQPVLARDEYAAEILSSTQGFGEGITGWAVEHREPVLANEAQRDPRVMYVPGTPSDEEEALISIPLIARGAIKGALNIYRLGGADFSQVEFELAQRFGDAAALALDNAQIRAGLEHQAQTDSLTGLYNHRFFHERLRTALQQASGGGDSVSVLMLDLDDFKRVNDVYGHAVGDEVLRELGAALRGAVRETDIVCRVGGEEFGVIARPSDRDNACRLAERLLELSASLDFGPAGRLTLSIGVTQASAHTMNPRELILCAEVAMMTAKARGKNRMVVFEETSHERPQESRAELRSIAHLKLVQSLGARLNRLNDLSEIGAVIADELRSLIDYHNCRVFLVEGDEVVPIAFRGDLLTDDGPTLDLLRLRVGEGITGRVAELGEPLRIADAANCEFGVTVPGTEAIAESIVAVPLLYGARGIGVIVVSKLGIDQFDDDDVRLLEVVAGHAAVAVENARLYDAQRRAAESATALLQFSHELAIATGLPEVLTRIVERSAAILRAPHTAVWLQDPSSGRVVLEAEYGHSSEGLDSPHAITPATLRAMDGPEQQQGFAVAPLELDSGRLGCIVAAARPDTPYSERELRLLGGLADGAKLAVTNAATISGLEQTFLSTVEALANALEANDEYTSSHTRWITDLSLKVGLELGLLPPALKRLELGALFHDIGKIGIPTTILRKPGRLTAQEQMTMETHPTLGERILAPIERLADVWPVIRHCHERFDGQGYPDGLAGAEIPLESRIIFVCDAFHAMTTDRPYRRRLSRAEACRRLEAGAGTQFDPVVVEACLRLVRAGGL